MPPTESICVVAADATGRWAATAACYSPDPGNRLLHVVDRRRGTARAFPLPGAEGDSPNAGSVQGLSFVSDGRLMAASQAGLHLWDPETGEHETLRSAPCLLMGASADGGRVVVGCKDDSSSGDSRSPTFDFTLIDVGSADRRAIEPHARDVGAIALSASGDLLATGDTNGVVRVGRTDGGEPHLLLGGTGSVMSLAFSPDGRWLASASGGELRLWPMPDVSRPPLHTLPLVALLATLDRLTNVRVVEDAAAPSGYTADLAPFPGWQDAPSW